MPDNKVVRYIKENLLKGHSVSDIKRYLILHNHSEKSVNEAIEAGNKEEAVVAMKTANKYLHHCVSKGILKKETAGRRVGRMQVKVNAL